MGMFFMKLALKMGKMSSISMVEDRICQLTSLMMFFKALELISAPKHEEVALLGPLAEVGLWPLHGDHGLADQSGQHPFPLDINALLLGAP